MMEKLKKLFIKEELNEEEQTASEEEASEQAFEEVSEQASDVTAEPALEQICEEVQDKSFADYTLGEVAALKSKMGYDSIAEDILSEEFAVFTEGRSGDLENQYTAFLKLKKVMEAKHLPKDNSARGETGQDKRVHSGFSGAMFKDASSGLTKRQMDMARSAGMSFREYEELLNSAPSKTKNRF